MKFWICLLVSILCGEEEIAVFLNNELDALSSETIRSPAFKEVRLLIDAKEFIRREAAEELLEQCVCNWVELRCVPLSPEADLCQLARRTSPPGLPCAAFYHVEYELEEPFRSVVIPTGFSTGPLQINLAVVKGGKDGWASYDVDSCDTSCRNCRRYCLIPHPRNRAKVRVIGEGSEVEEGDYLFLCQPGPLPTPLLTQLSDLVHLP